MKINYLVVLLILIFVFTLGCTGASTGSGSPTAPDFNETDPYELIVSFDIEGEHFEFNIIDEVIAIAKAEVFYELRRVQWESWSGLPYQGMNGTNMTDLQIIQHISAQLVGANFGWGTVFNVTGCVIYEDYMFPQIWEFHESNPFLQFPQFLVFIMESNLYDFKDDYNPADDDAPC